MPGALLDCIISLTTAHAIEEVTDAHFVDPNLDYANIGDIEEDSPYPEVRSAVANVDDPAMPCSTIRAWILGMTMAIIIPGLNQFLCVPFFSSLSTFAQNNPRADLSAIAASFDTHPLVSVVLWQRLSPSLSAAVSQGFCLTSRSLVPSFLLALSPSRSMCSSLLWPLWALGPHTPQTSSLCNAYFTTNDGISPVSLSSQDKIPSIFHRHVAQTRNGLPIDNFPNK